MRTRNQFKQRQQSKGEEDVSKPVRDSENQSCLEEINDSGTLTDISHDAIGKLLKRVKSRGLRGLNKEDSYLHQRESTSKLESESNGNDKQVRGTEATRNTSVVEGCSRNVIQNTPSKVKVEVGSFQHANSNHEDEINDSDWEEGSIPALNSTNDHREDIIKGVTVEFDVSPDSAKLKPIRRASAEEKELAELVHKVHLLCLLGRGRFIDNACNDPLIQASLLSLLPTHLLKIADVSKLTAKDLAPLVSWFHNTFRIRGPSSTERPFHSAVAFAFEAHEGTPEEVAALSVAPFRALNLTTRFVSILDVSSLKPDADKSELVGQDAGQAVRGIFHSSTLMVAKSSRVSVSPVKQMACDDKGNAGETSLRGACKTKDSKSKRNSSPFKDSSTTEQLNNRMSDLVAGEAQTDVFDVHVTNKSEGLKRKGDLEFEMQLEMALSATTVGITKSNIGSDLKDLHSNSSNLSSPLKRMKIIRSEEFSTSSQGISTAVGSRKVGAPLYWAEVYCSGENLTGKWVHVDVVNAIFDEEHKVEPAAAACKKYLRYVVAFAGHGAKDVTRRYCMRWYKIASRRVHSIWWDSVLAPLKELEAVATGGVVHLKQEVSNEGAKVKAPKISDHTTRECLPHAVSLPRKSAAEVPKDYGEIMEAESSVRNSFVATRTLLEDMELETRALTEPLPTNQQAYRNHQLYAIERWLTKYQILHPKGPILGFCSGNPVYPRTCVQTLHTKERWLREGLQIKVNELPGEVLKRSLKRSKSLACEEDEIADADCEGTVALYGKWQTEPLCLPHAVDGIVPKNERGQVDVWSEKCLPPGTVHLKLPRVIPVTKKLEIDFAPAMVRFEYRNGRAVPLFEGIVVCVEFQDAILEAYREEEDRREAEEKKRIETQAISRWYQLLSSIVTRQRLNNCYGNDASPQVSIDFQKVNDKDSAQVGVREDERHSPGCHNGNICDNMPSALQSVPSEDHEHVFWTEYQTLDEESLTLTKQCQCGFSIQVEEL